MKRFLCVTVFLLLAVASSCSQDGSLPLIRGIRNIFKEPPLPAASSSRRSILNGIYVPVDHFNASNTDTFFMRFYDNGEYYVPGGPIFIFIGGEWTISPGMTLAGHMHDMARDMGGYLFYTEHRYYGETFPTPDASTENLQFLDVDQALADLAFFVDYVKEHLLGAETSGVIVVGGSYSATMAAWFRQRYPDKVKGAWASSAPLLAQLDFPEYMDVVSWAMGHVGGSLCSDRIRDAFAEVERLLAIGDTELLKSTFGMCEEVLVNDPLDVANFVSGLAYEFAGVVQYHWPGDIEEVCNYMTAPETPTPLEALGRFIRAQYGPYCMDARYQSFIDYFKDPSWSSGSTQSAMRQWLYQTCNEFGWYQTAADGRTIFGSSMPLKLSLEMCADLYDNHFNETFMQYKIDRTNRMHNGWTPMATNVFYTHGSLDPWRMMGVQSDVNADSPVVILEGYSHCADLDSISSWDSEQMRATKERITAKVRQWLGM